MANRWSLNHRALEDILMSDEVIKVMHDVADKIVDSTPKPDDYEIQEWVGRSRARVSIVTVGIQAHVREARDHNLVRALAGAQELGPNSLIEYTSRAGRVSYRTQAEVANYTRNHGD